VRTEWRLLLAVGVPMVTVYAGLYLITALLERAYSG
jgi:hypothetical protein